MTKQEMELINLRSRVEAQRAEIRKLNQIIADLKKGESK